MDTAIQYDRTTRGYRVVNQDTGEVTMAANRYEAERALIHTYAPDVLALADHIAARFPELAGRAHKAALLVARAQVRPNGSDGAFLVASETHQPEVYRVDTHALTCSCEDWHAAAAGEAWGAPVVGGQPHCKHLLAAMLYQRRGA